MARASVHHVGADAPPLSAATQHSTFGIVPSSSRRRDQFFASATVGVGMSLPCLALHAFDVGQQ